jgi:hypothetical protein
MSTDRDVTRIVRSWIDAGVTVLPDRVLDAVLDQVPAIPQRRAGWPVRRFPPMNRFVGVGLVAAAVLLAAFMAIEANVGTKPAPVATTTPAPTAKPQVPKPYAGAEPGRYLILGPWSDAPLPWLPDEVSATLPAGWEGNGPSQGGGIDEYSETAAPRAKLRIGVVLNVTVDGCSSSTPWLSPPIGPSIDDLVGGLVAIPGVEVTQPERARLAGFSGVRMDLRVPTGLPDCESFHLWRLRVSFHDGGIETKVYSSPQGWLHELWILDVTGHRLVIDASRAADAPAELVQELEKIVQSIDIKP